MTQDKKLVAFVIYPGFSLLELVASYSPLAGLLTDLSYRLVVVGTSREAVASDTPLKVLPDMTFDEAPRPELLFVIGGEPPSAQAAEDKALRKYVRTAAESAARVGSTGTGSLILGAAGLLAGKQATVNWDSREALARYGGNYVRKPWLEDGKLITAAGVSGAFEMGLHLLAAMRGQGLAQTQQLFAEYDPQPPFGGIDWVGVERGDFNPDRLASRPAGPAREIAFVLYEGLTPLDLIGPLGVFAALARIAPEFHLSVVAKQPGPIMADNGLKFAPDKTFAEAPRPNALVVPGGGEPTLRAMVDADIRQYVRTVAETADFVGSVCTGALILAGTGLLKGKAATTHWAYYKVLEALGSPYRRQRWVDNGKIINSAGVSAGIDMALYWVAKMTDKTTAHRVQLDIQYDPHPPFGRIDWNHLSLMPRLLRGAMSLRAPFIARKAGMMIAQGR